MTERLLRRVAYPGEGKRSSEDSVKEYLQIMLNTRHGGNGTCPDFGMPSIDEMAQMPEDVISIVIKETVNCIKLYEPRLDKLKLIKVDAKKFLMAAELFIKNKNIRFPVNISIIFDERCESIDGFFGNKTDKIKVLSVERIS